ncbi:MAG: type I secretion system permease/ATPase [Caulobacterales bacterium]
MARAAKASSSSLIRDALKACRAHVWAVVIFSAAVNILYLAPTLYMLQVYDRVMQTSGVATLLFVTLALVVALIVLAALDGLRGRILVHASNRMNRLVSPAILEMAFSGRPDSRGAKVQHAMREFDIFRSGLTGPIALSVIDAPWAPIYILCCFLIHPVIGCIALFGAILLFCIALMSERAFRAATKEASARIPNAYAAQEADTAAAEAARALGMRKVLIARNLQERTNIAAAQTDGAFSQTRYTAVARFFRLFLQSAGLGMGAYLAIHGDVSAGAVFASSILVARGIAPIEQIVGSWRTIAQSLTAFTNLKGMLEARPAEEVRTPLPAPRGVMAMERVGVKSPEGDRALIQEITLNAQPGDIIGVVGPSGAGKTTFARVLAGATAADFGAVRIDGAKYDDWDADALGRYIGYLPQDVSLLSGTVAENIARFTNKASDADHEKISADVVTAAKLAGAHELILRLPKGFDTQLGPMGRGLSTGQAQRIALARALFRDPVLLVLDEPNAHVDAEGEAALVNALKAAKARGAVCFVVAHRAGFMTIADKLLVLSDGRIQAFGPREEVAAKLAPVPPQRPAPAPRIVSET